MGAIFWIVVVLVATTLGVVAYGYWLLSHLSFHLVKKADTVAQHDDVPEPTPRVPPRFVCTAARF
jgi:flagellar basal body-associated protein FliL